MDQASAIVTAEQKEWDVWKMPQFILQQYCSGKLVKSNMIRISRLVNDGETKVIKIDAPVTDQDIDHVSVSFWNAGSDHNLLIRQLSVVGIGKD